MHRRTLFSISIGLLLVSASACGAADRPRVDPRVAAEVEVNKNDPPWGCGFLGPVKGATLVGELGDAHGDLLRNAVLNGGNYVAVDLIERPVVVGVGGYTVRGRLFICPKRQAPAAQPSTVFRAPQGPQGAQPEEGTAARSAKTSNEVIIPKAICEPDCSPGYTCLHAQCVSACNPGCGVGEQCGADRICHSAR